MHSVGGMQNFLMLTLVVHKVTTGQEFTDEFVTVANPSETSHENSESLGYKFNLMTFNAMEALR
jgi:hypothetical protein